MPYLRPATNNQFGLQPANGPQGRTNLYPVSSSEATAVLPGDAMVWTSSATVRVAVGADTRGFVGAAAAPLAVADFAATTLNCLIYDDPDQVYAIAVTTSVGMTIGNYGKAFGVITTATGTGIPASAVGRSAMALAVATATSGQMLQMLGLHPVEALASGGFVVTTSVGKPQKYLVTPNPMALITPLTT